MSRTEIIAFASGKGGTGKTLFAASMANALVRSKLNVLVIDGDPGTDGLSLFLLGPEGWKQLRDYSEANTFTGYLNTFAHTGSAGFEPRRINRLGNDDHRAVYTALVSARAVYGDEMAPGSAIPELTRGTFRSAVSRLFEALRANDEFDYVLVDTRGGFAFESTDVCALADSFIVVTEPDYTSFYQDRNLVSRVSTAARELDRRPVLRTIIVNKATDNEEKAFRLELEREFPLRFDDTYAVPLDVEAIMAYKSQRMPFVAAPASRFSYAVIKALASILGVVTARWQDHQIQAWEAVVDEITQAITERNRQIEAADRASQEQVARIEKLVSENEQYAKNAQQLTRELEQARDLYREEGRRQEERQGMVLAELDRLRTELERPKSPGPEVPRSALKLGSARLLAAMILVPLLMVGAIGLVGFAFRGYIERAVRGGDGALRDIYAVSTPPPLRVQALQVVLRGKNVRLDNLDLSSLDLKGMDLTNLKGTGITLINTNLEGAVLSGAELVAASFKRANLRGARLRQANLTEADFSEAKLEKADLQDADLQHSILTDTNLSGANLRGVRLEGAVIERTVLSGATLDLTVLESARVKSAQLPDGRFMINNTIDSKEPPPMPRGGAPSKPRRPAVLPF